MGKYICSVCGYIYDESKGIPEAGIAPGTMWNDLPEDWVCPLCGASKSEFVENDEPARSDEQEPLAVFESFEDMKELSPLEISALCTNLARGCEKQYKPEEAALFNELADYYKSVSGPNKTSDFDQLIALIGKDLEEGFSKANATASNAGDRGARRALVWSEKVTRILKSLLNRYRSEDNATLENTGVYVCTICGFVFIGDKVPVICPICKAPDWKFEKIEGRQ